MPLIGIFFLLLGSADFIFADKKIQTLVLLETMSLKQLNDDFFTSLKERNHFLDFRLPTDPKLALQTYGEYNYDNLIIIGSKINKFGGSLSVDAILKYLDDGHNLLLAVDENVSDTLRGLANECGIDFDPKETRIQDHQNHDVSDQVRDHTLVLSDAWVDAPVLVGEPPAPVLFRGIGQALDRKSKLIFPILTGIRTTISSNPDQSTSRSLVSQGKNTILVSALQGRNNARATFIGSTEMCTNKFYHIPAESMSAKIHHEKSGNQEFCTSLAKWTFKETGFLRATNVVHHLASNNSILNPAVYTIKDHIKYSVDISEWSWSDQTWKPFKKDDVQIELVRMDPFQLRTMETDKNGHFWSEFQLPDVFGIYHFTIDYQRRGYTHLVSMNQISVRPFKHNEHPRFLKAAYPYYAAEFSMMIGFLAFTFVFLFHRDRPAKQKHE